MDESLWPIFIRLQGRAVLLLGGDGEAGRKGMALLSAGARLTIVAPALEGELLGEVLAGRAIWKRETFQPAHLEGMWLVVSVLVDATLNARLYAAAQESGVWLNVVDQPQFCTFIWPAVVERPPVLLAISTGGTSPALAGYLRRRLEVWLPVGIGPLAKRLSVWRESLAGDLPMRARFWRELLEQGVAERFLDGDEAGATDMVQAALEKQKRENPAANGDRL